MGATSSKECLRLLSRIKVKDDLNQTKTFLDIKMIKRELTEKEFIFLYIKEQEDWYEYQDFMWNSGCLREDSWWDNVSDLEQAIYS